MTIGSTEYKRLLARWRQLIVKQDHDGLTRQEAAEMVRVNEQLGAAEVIEKGKNDGQATHGG